MAWNVLILGGGFGGLYAARKLERALPPHAAKVTVVTDVNFMLYTPLLPGAAAGTLEPRHVVVPLREHLDRTDLLIGHVTGADPDRHVVQVTTADGHERELGYDHLIVTLGAISRTLPVPGLREHAVGFKTLSDAVALRNQILQTLERAEATDDEAARRALLTYVFVGCGDAGWRCGRTRRSSACPPTPWSCPTARSCRAGRSPGRRVSSRTRWSGG